MAIVLARKETRININELLKGKPSDALVDGLKIPGLNIYSDVGEAVHECHVLGHPGRNTRD